MHLMAQLAVHAGFSNSSSTQINELNYFLTDNYIMAAITTFTEYVHSHCLIEMFSHSLKTEFIHFCLHALRRFKLKRLEIMNIVS